MCSLQRAWSFSRNSQNCKRSHSDFILHIVFYGIFRAGDCVAESRFTFCSVVRQTASICPSHVTRHRINDREICKSCRCTRRCMVITGSTHISRHLAVRYHRKRHFAFVIPSIETRSGRRTVRPSLRYLYSASV